MVAGAFPRFGELALACLKGVRHARPCQPRRRGWKMTCRFHKEGPVMSDRIQPGMAAKCTGRRGGIDYYGTHCLLRHALPPQHKPIPPVRPQSALRGIFAGR